MAAGNDHQLGRTIIIVAAATALLGVAVAGGSLLTGAGTEATTGDALPYAAAGALAGVVLTLLAHLVVRAIQPELRSPRLHEALGALFIAAALGALIATALTPRTPRPDEVSPLPDEVIEQRRAELDEVVRAGPVDFDQDGQVDLDENGDPIIGYDEDGDGEVDGYLTPCPDDSPVGDQTQRPGQQAIDFECDGEVDRYVELTDEPFVNRGDLPPFEDRPLPTIPPEQRAERAVDQGADGQWGAFVRNLLIALAVIAVGAAIIIYLIKRPDPEKGEATAPAPPPPPEQRPAIAIPMEASIDALLADPDPRTGICAAYGVLLEQLAVRGLPRRPEEAPEEHMRRCLVGSAIDERAASDLLDLFGHARFSTHPVTEEHRLAAIRAMRRAVESQQHEPTAGATSSPLSPPPPPGD